MPYLSHLPKGAVVLARPPGLHMGETPPLRTDMDEDQKKRVAIFRFGVTSDFFVRDYMERGERERLLRDKCTQRWQIPFSNRTRLSRSTILGWVRLYRKAAASWNPATLWAGMIGAAAGLGRGHRPGPGPPEQGTAHCVSDYPNQREDAPTLDRRRLEAAMPNDSWQSDAMHGPMFLMGDKRRKTYLFALIDGMNRLIAHAEFYLSEGLATYLQALRQALLKLGLPRKLYLDNGPAFRSHHLGKITASLGIALIHSPPYVPQGKGKIEKFFRTVRSQFLPGFKGDTLRDINEALECWVRDVYHQRKHLGTGQAPL
ncbi:transposase [Desulfarculales bacterium]